MGFFQRSHIILFVLLYTLFSVMPARASIEEQHSSRLFKGSSRKNNSQVTRKPRDNRQVMTREPEDNSQVTQELGELLFGVSALDLDDEEEYNELHQKTKELLNAGADPTASIQFYKPDLDVL